MKNVIYGGVSMTPLNATYYEYADLNGLDFVKRVGSSALFRDADGHVFKVRKKEVEELIERAIAENEVKDMIFRKAIRGN